MQINHLRCLVLTGVLALAGCGDVVPRADNSQPSRPAVQRVPPAPPPPQQRPYAPPRPPVPPLAVVAPPDWRDGPLAAGDWTWQSRPGGSVARYGTIGNAPLALLVCDHADATLSVVEPVPPFISHAQPSRSATITTSTSAGTFVASAQVIDGLDALAITLPVNHRILDAMAFSRGRFKIEITGIATLVLPSWSEVGRVIEDCRG